MQNDVVAIINLPMIKEALKKSNPKYYRDRLNKKRRQKKKTHKKKKRKNKKDRKVNQKI